MNKICQEKNTSSSDRNLCFYPELVSLAEKMKSDCYLGEKNSEEIKLDFKIGIVSIRSKFYEYSE